MTRQPPFEFWPRRARLAIKVVTVMKRDETGTVYTK